MTVAVKASIRMNSKPIAAPCGVLFREGNMEYTKRITCPECSGSGHLENEVCFYCEGKGQVDAFHVDPYAYDLQWKDEAAHA